MSEPLDGNWKTLGQAAARVVQRLTDQRAPFRLYTDAELRAMYPPREAPAESEAAE